MLKDLLPTEVFQNKETGEEYVRFDDCKKIVAYCTKLEDAQRIKAASDRITNYEFDISEYPELPSGKKKQQVDVEAVRVGLKKELKLFTSINAKEMRGNAVIDMAIDYLNQRGLLKQGGDE